MLKMTDRFSSYRKHGRLPYEIAFSVYLPMLAIVANAAVSVQHPAGKSWIDSIQSLIPGTRQVISYRVMLCLLWLISAMVIFLILRMAPNLSVMDLFLRTCGGLWPLQGFR
jgi:hypothetical protein